MTFLKDKLVIDTYKPILRNECSQVLLLTGYKKERLTEQVTSYTFMVFGIRILWYTN